METLLWIGGGLLVVLVLSNFARMNREGGKLGVQAAAYGWVATDSMKNENGDEVTYYCPKGAGNHHNTPCIEVNKTKQEVRIINPFTLSDKVFKEFKPAVMHLLDYHEGRL